MESIDHDTSVNARIARRVRQLRADAALSLEALAERSGVSRSMISVIERGESSPTAVVLERLATGLGVMLADLFTDPNGNASPLSRRANQLTWRDPQSGYERRNLSPATFGSPLQLVEVNFPPGARVAYETGLRSTPVHEQVWLIAGALEITLGEHQYQLTAGDCLATRLDQPIVFHNPGPDTAHYLVAIVSGH